MTEEQKIWTATPTQTHFPSTVYLLRLTLLETPYPVWREILVNGQDRMTDLAYVLRTSMGWPAQSAYDLRVDDTYFYDGNSCHTLTDGFDGDNFWVEDVINAGSDVCFEIYDASITWTHSLTLIKIMRECVAERPFCVRASGSCPPVYLGRLEVFTDLLQACTQPNNQRAKDYNLWLGSPFSPSTVPLDAINANLQS